MSNRYCLSFNIFHPYHIASLCWSRQILPCIFRFVCCGKSVRTLSWCYFLLGHERQTGRRKNSPRWQCWTAVDKAPTLSRLFKSVNLEPCKNSMIWKFKQGTQTVKTQQKRKLRTMQEPCVLMLILWVSYLVLDKSVNSRERSIVCTLCCLSVCPWEDDKALFAPKLG